MMHLKQNFKPSITQHSVTLPNGKSDRYISITLFKEQNGMEKVHTYRITKEDAISLRKMLEGFTL